MSWKQPIPTGLDNIFGKDKRAKQMYKELIYCACNEDGVFTDSRGKHTPIKRGQVIYGRNKFANELGWDDMTADRSLKRLSETYKDVRRPRADGETEEYTLVSMQRNKNFTVVTINNYDEIVYMSNQMSKQRASSEQAVSTSKSVKSDKSVKKEERERVFERLNQPQLWTIAKNNSVAFTDVVSKQEDVFDSLANGNKKIHDIRATVSSWVRYSINHKTMEQLSPEDMQIEAETYDPSLEAERQRKKLLVKEIDGNNKSSLDFARSSKVLS